ncbi:zinc-binding protein [Methanocella sp. CWC-04]|uniref:Zinc-binding protein n=1 Tax=Methanooceanicella nereidis TaxID=2052831 RepID=A0AAP2RDE5_9EURY|nr:putative zinc-binding protein [Methanocella sp. CWC-04]MCD1293950.1 zinc-binding protein [Methanocella sp. CWC-04]
MDNKKVENKEGCSCGCGTAPKIIYPCSGSADVGEIADRAARKLTKDGVGKMSCLAGIGGGISGLLAVADCASAILVIDGCPQNCAKKTLEKAGYMEFKHIMLSDMGMAKGKTPVNEENIASVTEKGEELLIS